MWFKHIQWLKNEIRWNLLLRGILVLIPFACLFLITENSYWLQVSVLTMSTLIVEEKLRLTLLAVLLHGIAVIFLFNLLLITQHQPLFFILVCTIAAVITIWISTQGERLRTLGNWTFIPAIILSIELATEMKYKIWDLSREIFPYFLAALLPTLIIGLYEQIKAIQQRQPFNLLQLSYLTDFGKKENNLESMIAMALGIIISASLVEYLPMENGQWMIWGVASVITGNVETTPKKFYQRFIGVSMGVPAGVIFGKYVVPATPFNLTLITICLFLTLVAFRRYVIAYAFRCFFVATALMLITHSSTIAFERFSHVTAGGLIGLACVLLTRFLFSKAKRVL